MDRSVNKWLLVLFCAGIALLTMWFVDFGRKHALTLGKIPVPADNPLSADKIELGRRLFFDKRLSDDNSISCASCHFPEKAFTDGKRLSDGVRGGKTMRNAPSLLNSAYLPRLMYDGQITSLELQMLVPLQDHAEMASDMRLLILELQSDPTYVAAAKRIFNRPFDAFVLTRAIAAYERSLIAQNSPFDRYWNGDRNALTASQKRGWKVFRDKLYCTECHVPPHFTDYSNQCNGLYKDYGSDQGRYRIDWKESEKGVFKTPSLRNSELTAPYMHDGSKKSLTEVIRHYGKGGEGHVNQSTIIRPFVLSAREEKDLINFFKSLTDTSYLRKSL